MQSVAQMFIMKISERTENEIWNLSENTMRSKRRNSVQRVW